MRYSSNILTCYAFFAALCENSVVSGNGNLRKTMTTMEYDCNAGCGLDEVGHGPPICGEDGNTYFNECLAVCQGIAVIRPGACPGSREFAPDDDSYVRQGFVPLAAMQRFKDRNFKFVAQRKLKAVDLDNNENRGGQSHGNGNNNSNNNGGNNGKNNGDSVNKNPRSVRVTPEGYEYISEDMDVPLVVPVPSDAEPFAGDVTDGGENRNLKVIDDDTRNQVTYTIKFPYRVIGQLMGDLGWCTGTVVSATSIVTAGHCVFSTFDETWKQVNSFVPARNGSFQPFGSWDVDYMTTYYDYAIGGRGGDYDFAVVTLKPRVLNGIEKSVGQVVGWAGIRETKDDSLHLQNSKITGYPADKPPGEMWTSGSCPPIAEYSPYFNSRYYSTPGSYYGVEHVCDTTSGNSGAALLGPYDPIEESIADNYNQYYVHGIHYGGTSIINYGNIVRGPRFYHLCDWAGISRTVY